MLDAMPARRYRPVRATLAVAAIFATNAFAADIAVPDKLRTDPAQTLALEARATGDQVYICNAAKTGGGSPEWDLKAPDAVLADAGGAKLGTHYAGPTWEAADGSKVVGKMKASAPAPGEAIPWLLLGVKSTEGKGVFTGITAIQRLATEGGKAPTDGCTAGNIGKEARVPYKAVYRFYR